MITSIGAPLVLAFALSLVVVPLCRLAATRLGYVARPREDRWHHGTVALFGGVAISTVLFVCAAIFGIAREQPVLVVSAALMFGTGLVDDVLSIKPATKLIAQLALACALLFFDYRLNWLQSTTLDSLLTLMWIVGLTNAFNLLDNMDGLCAGIALIVGTALLIDLLPGDAALAPQADGRHLGCDDRLIQAELLRPGGGACVPPRDDSVRRVSGRHPRLRGIRYAGEAGSVHADCRRVHVQASRRRGLPRL